MYNKMKCCANIQLFDQTDENHRNGFDTFFFYITIVVCTWTKLFLLFKKK